MLTIDSDYLGGGPSASSKPSSVIPSSEPNWLTVFTSVTLKKKKWAVVEDT